VGWYITKHSSGSLRHPLTEKLSPKSMATLTYREADKDADSEFGRMVHHSGYGDVVTRQFGSWDESMQDAFFQEG
jgi:hypothetical protein